MSPAPRTSRTSRTTRALRALAWLAGIAAFGFFALGGFAYELFIGLDWTAYPFGAQIHALFEGLGWAGRNAMTGLFYIGSGAALVALVCGAFAWRASGRRQVFAARGADLARRGLLASAAGVGAAALAGGVAALRGALGWGRAPDGWAAINQSIQAKVVQTHPQAHAEWSGARIRETRRLGRTEFQISDVVVGAGRIGRKPGAASGSDIVKLAFERGVNYVDTSPDYSETGSESAVAEALRGQREKIFVATKFCTPWGHLGAGAKVSEYKAVVEGSLQRLGTDYVDLVHIHACDSRARLLDPNVHEAFDALKQEGKVRFLGFSTHTPNLEDVVAAGIESGRFDVMMLAYHHGQWPRLAELIERGVREQDMGVIAMKTLKGAKQQNLAAFSGEQTAYSQAALRWVLSNPLVSAAVISFYEFQHVDEYLYASGGRANAGDAALLERYDRAIAGSYCAPHCGACLSSCPEGLPIHDVLRHRMYFEDYGDEKEAMRLYGQLERNASACANCAAPCLGACPLGINIPERMRGAHDLLTLAS